MKYGILILSLLLVGCNQTSDQSELEEIRRELDALSFDAKQYDDDYVRQTADYDRQTQVVDDQHEKLKNRLIVMKNFLNVGRNKRIGRIKFLMQKKKTYNKAVNMTRIASLLFAMGSAHFTAKFRSRNAGKLQRR